MKIQLFVVSLITLVLSFSIVFIVTAQAVPQDWVQVNSDGFGNPQNSIISALSPFNGQLYAGTYNNGGEGAQLMETRQYGLVASHNKWPRYYTQCRH
jgi:hypothetical protein